VLHINQIDPTKRQADVTLRLFLPTLDALSIVDESDGRKVFSDVVPGHDWGKLEPGQPAFVITKAEWKDAQLEVTVTATNQIWRGQVPLRLLGYPPQEITPTGPLPKDEAAAADPQRRRESGRTDVP
jgi:hypothetical protein